MADKTIDSLPEASAINANDLLVMQQAGSAKSVTGQLLESWLVALADGHGGVQSIIKTDTTGLVDTYTITYADLTTSTFTVTNGAKGDKGDKGDTGDLNAVKSCTTQYASSDDGATHPESGWSTTANPVKGKYLWTQTELVFADASSTTFYNVNYCGTDGTGAVSSVDGKTGDVDLSGTYLALADTKSVGSNDNPIFFDSDGKPVASDLSGTYLALDNAKSTGDENTPVYFNASGTPVACDLDNTYLPLSGGTLTGALNGVTIKTSGYMSTNNKSTYNDSTYGVLISGGGNDGGVIDIRHTSSYSPIRFWKGDSSYYTSLYPSSLTSNSVMVQLPSRSGKLATEANAETWTFVLEDESTVSKQVVLV